MEAESRLVEFAIPIWLIVLVAVGVVAFALLAAAITLGRRKKWTREDVEGKLRAE